MKKVLSLSMASLMALSMGAAAVAESATTTLFPTGENGYPDLGGATLTIWSPMDASMTEFIDTFGDLKVIQELEAKLNCDLVFVHPAVGAEQEGFSTMLASNEYPDIIIANYVDDYYAGGLSMAYDDGFIADVSDLISAETTPNFYAKVMSDPYLVKMAIDDYDRIVGLGSQVSGSETACTCMWGMMVRKDFLEATGLSVPETIDQWTEMLRAFKANGIQYPLLLNKSGYFKSRNAFSSAWNIDARNFYVTADGEVAYGPTSAEFKDYIGTLAMWYAEGLINPDFGSDTQDDTWAMLASGEGAALVDHIYKYAASYYNTVEVANPDQALLAIQMPKLNAEDELNHVMVTSRGLGKRKYITEACQNKEAAVAFLDALYLDDIEFMLSNGIEGEGYNLNEMGYPVITDVEYNENATDDQKRGMRLYEMETESDSDLDYILTSKYCYGVQPECVKNYVQCSYDRYINEGGLSFTTEEAEVLADVRTDVETYRDEMMMKFITGEADIDAEFDSYVETINGMGLDQMTEVYAAAYARYIAR